CFTMLFKACYKTCMLWHLISFPLCVLGASAMKLVRYNASFASPDAAPYLFAKAFLSQTVGFGR
ncbi:MAG: hypothetical protein JSV01_00615, partial [Desulfobacterales bacterium]